MESLVVGASPVGCVVSGNDTRGNKLETLGTHLSVCNSHCKSLKVLKGLRSVYRLLQSLLSSVTDLLVQQTLCNGNQCCVCISQLHLAGERLDLDAVPVGTSLHLVQTEGQRAVSHIHVEGVETVLRSCLSNLTNDGNSDVVGEYECHVSSAVFHVGVKATVRSIQRVGIQLHCVMTIGKTLNFLLHDDTSSGNTLVATSIHLSHTAVATILGIYLGSSPRTGKTALSPAVGCHLGCIIGRNVHIGNRFRDRRVSVTTCSKEQNTKHESRTLQDKRFLDHRF